MVAIMHVWEVVVYIVIRGGHRGSRFCSFLQHHGLRLLVLIVGDLRFADGVHGFSVAL